MVYDISGQDGAYRRGLLLGFTMAEMMTLILFTLLLALAFAFMEQDKVIADLNEKIAGYVATGIDPKVAAVAERFARLWQSRAPERDPSEYFTELVAGFDEAEKTRGALQDAIAKLEVARDVTAQLRAEADAASEKLAASQEELDAIKKTMDPNDAAVVEAVGRAGLGSAPPAEIESVIKAGTAVVAASHGQSVGEVINVAEGVSKAAAVAKKTPSDWIQGAQGAALELNDAKGVIKQLEGQLGNGRVLPSCWSDEAKKIEYVLDVRLKSGGIEALVRPLPHRRGQLVELLGSETIDAREMSDARFLAMTHKMFDWSVRQNCRFYVMVYDATAEHEKKLYKSHLKAVEGHFYKLELVD